MPTAKQKSPAKKKEKELSDSEVPETDTEEQPTIARSTRSKKGTTKRYTSKTLKEMSKINSTKKTKPKRKFISLNDEAKISASNAYLLNFIVGSKIAVGRNEITHRAKTFLRSDEEFKNLKLTVTALNNISLVMNHRFGCLFRIASILAEFRNVQTITALELDMAKEILDGKLGSLNSDPNKYFALIKEYRNKNFINTVDNRFADNILAATETVTSQETFLTKSDIKGIFDDSETMKKISKELKKYHKPISSDTK